MMQIMADNRGPEYSHFEDSWIWLNSTASAGSSFSEYAWGYTEWAENLHIVYETERMTEETSIPRLGCPVGRLYPSIATSHSNTFTRVQKQTR